MIGGKDQPGRWRRLLTPATIVVSFVLLGWGGFGVLAYAVVESRRGEKIQVALVVAGVLLILWWLAIVALYSFALGGMGGNAGLANVLPAMVALNLVASIGSFALLRLGEGVPG